MTEKIGAGMIAPVRQLQKRRFHMKGRAIQQIIRVIVIVCFASSYVVSYEDDEVTVTITNRTSRYLHVLINNAAFLYVAPGGHALTETPFSTAYVEVFYSPGQGVSGRGFRELTSVTHYTSSGGRTCSSSNNDGGCQYEDAISAESSHTRSPMSWSVTPSDISADTTYSSNR